MKFSFIILLFVLMFISLNSAVKETDSGIEFNYEAPNAQTVFLAGSLNDWNTTKNPLKKDENGIWKTTIKLSSGKHSYKFVVDGNWFFDQDNPNIEDDGYGGSNSLVEIDTGGKLVKVKTQIFSGVKSTFNPKVYFHGRYYTQNIFDKNNNERYYLDKPEHDLNLGIKIKFNNDFEGYTVLNINNNAEGSEMWKTHLNYKRTYLKLKTNYFNVNAFDDYGMITSDDPLHIIGDEGKYHYDFGYGYRGVYAESSDGIFKFIPSQIPLKIKAQVLYADELGDAEGDYQFGRTSFKYSHSNKENQELDLKIGGSLFKAKFKEHADYEIYDYNCKELDFSLNKNFFQNGWKNPMNLQIQTEYLFFDDTKEFLDFGYDPYIILVNQTWLTGSSTFLGTSVTFPVALKLSASYRKNDLNFYFEEDQDQIIYLPSPDLIKETISKDRFTFSSNFETESFSSYLELQYWKNSFPDSLVSWADYYKYLEKTDGNGRWFQKYSEVPFEKYTVLGYKTGLIWKANFSYRNKIFKFPFEFKLDNTFAHQDFLYVPKYIENIVVFKLDISPKWNLYTNTRIPYYNDDVLNLKTDFKENIDVFYANYSEVMYHLSDNIKLSLGWGVNPETLNSVTDEFYQGGREEFLESADNFAEFVESTYRGMGEKIRNAEIQLKREQRITLQAVVTF